MQLEKESKKVEKTNLGQENEIFEDKAISKNASPEKK